MKQERCVAYGTHLHIFSVKDIRVKTYNQNIGGINSSNIRNKISYQIASLGTRALQS